MGLDFEGEEEGGDFDNRDRISILEHPLKRSSIIAGYSKSNDKYGDQSILNAELERLYEEIYNENKDHKSQGNLYRASSSKRGENVALKKKKFWNFHPKEEQRSVQSYQSKKRGHEKKKISASERASVGNTFGSDVFESGYGNGNLVSQKMANYGSLDNEATENYLFARKNFEEEEIFSDNILDFNPHWEDMITFRESRLKRQKSRTWSESDTPGLHGSSDRTICDFGVFSGAGGIVVGFSPNKKPPRIHE
ncbi:hypothetical protein AX774_g3407 [Zancudomyces culisetae]|uniref:Uncharacterized protein n=1 Tax=Zancudomyces culisetae TaxID=1213189 RepID=A0A1R1PQ36_ZANCU|nr:hypothetical protein AX774_g4555 [Zancudomyces culisetae]OMH83070.1 hypothetical protein AX774_g3407 [Zancudomyces culisetae]|eukprot:OMH81983.1 hypothetical protein AX774_g4555 [Zancudomyces culisetae]